MASLFENNFCFRINEYFESDFYFGRVGNKKLEDKIGICLIYYNGWD